MTLPQDERPAGKGRLAPLQSFYAIAKMLLQFESVARALPAIMAIVAKVLPLRNGVLIECGDDTRTTVWLADGTPAKEGVQAVTHAQRMLQILGGQDAEGLAWGGGLDPEVRAERLQRHFLTLPLIQARPPIFGVLQIESDSPLDEADMVFMDVVSAQLAIALSRHYLTRREIALKKEAQRALSLAFEANQRYEDLLAMVAHDLRNPLTAIVLNAEILSKTVTGAKPGSERIRLAAQRMNSLIGNLLDMAQIKAGRLTIQGQSLMIESIVAEAVEAMQPLVAKRNQHLSHAITPGLPPVWADRDRLLQVFANLIGNAVKFTPDGGTITVRATLRKSEVCVAVQDTGIGITPDQQDHVYDRFWQAEDGSRKGAGLGLAIVKGIVDASGGQLWMKSKPGDGTTFFFTLPVAGPADQGIPDPTQHRPAA